VAILSSFLLSIADFFGLSIFPFNCECLRHYGLHQTGLKPVENQKDVIGDNESSTATGQSYRRKRRLKKRYKINKVDIFYSLQEIVFITTSQMCKKKW
jgi:hypothetical protein